MRWLSIVSVAMVLAGCDGCGDEAVSPPTGGAPAASGADVEKVVPVDQAKPGDIYKNAYERAEKEITPDNAADRLREIERSIDREAGPRR